ncbi:uncharacterized protein Z518_02944 [Rhinocladiella mackenziei CBS 650.93]|uniref:Cytoplasmic tRNA 2-thiolation protein 2 n=1 Tax=Rhinocladiella mackenziei CBS 650.93 TaxID=1442369 RepID=A0A0D2HCU0_9EURO|nr:uncharacterized protein Z518_02944 [Rhinocladiella mackenziei CBS 650.93]KIX08288.1 hypothetical protein Z518_02944 [Rhinocladiella mackenziei CBS 650.93]
MTIELCVDCRERDASLHVRNRRLCAACFIRYVTSKILKRMESYRFKNLRGDQKRRLFLPISGGVSSFVLLQILDAQLQKQIANRNRTAYDLVVVRVMLLDEDIQATVRSSYEDVAHRFPMHVFLPLLALHDVLRLDRNLERDLKHIGIQRKEGEPDEILTRRMLSSTASVATRTELQSILLQRLLVSAAKEQKCESILWGHSDSRLAALVLADVAKGRGGSVPSTIADGLSPHGINFNYPMRDLFKTELQTYAQTLSDPLLHGVAQNDDTSKPPSTVRNTSIDSLLNTYITSQGEKYPSLVANVVRTASKLELKNTGDNVIACPVCAMTNTTSTGMPNSNSSLCYGCQRMKQDIRS